MDLFDYNREQQVRREGPLAARMRPRTLDEYIGQEHILAPGRLLRRAIQADQLASLIFYGPPGTGKTTLASVIANTTKSLFITLNAVLAGVADLRTITEAAQRLRGEHNRRTILFIDEVHRWNKAQQDALLPWVENGTVILIGATTENPYFTVNRALVSRSRIFQLQPLTADHLKTVIRQTLTDPERGYGKLTIDLHADALHHLADVANGDARAALNAIELAVETTPPNADGVIHIDMAVAEESIQQRAVLYDKEGDYHFDTISAFIKSLRGSDPDAALYWLAKMVYAGEDPRFMFRRMLIFAGEDVGLADPQALVVVTAAAGAFDRVGMPEGNFHLATACLYLATCPKSNSVMGFFDALALVGKEKEGEVPNHLKDASRDKEGFGHGAGYQYPHAYRDHWVAQQYLPDSLQGKVLYNPGRLGFENGLAELVRQRRELQLAALREAEDGLAPAEILSFSPPDKATDRWLARTLDGLGTAAAAIRERVFAATRPRRQDRILDLSADAGLFVWEALRQAPEGGVWALTSQAAAARALAEQAATLPDLRRPELLTGPPGELRNLLAASGNAEVRFDLMVGRNVLARAPDRAAVLCELRHLLAPGATLSLAENLPRYGTRLAPFVPTEKVTVYEMAGASAGSAVAPAFDTQAGLPALRSEQARLPVSPSFPVTPSLRVSVATAEEAVYGNVHDPLVNWDEETLAAELAAAGFVAVRLERTAFTRQQRISSTELERWFAADTPGSYASRLRAAGLAEEELRQFRTALTAALAGKTVPWPTTTVFLTARTPQP